MPDVELQPRKVLDGHRLLHSLLSLVVGAFFARADTYMNPARDFWRTPVKSLSSQLRMFRWRVVAAASVKGAAWPVPPSFAGVCPRFGLADGAECVVPASTWPLFLRL